MSVINVNNTTVQVVGNVLGYTIGVPQSHFNPLSYLKENCPVWVIHKDSYKVFFVKDEKKIDEDLSAYIKSNLPQRDGFSLKTLCSNDSELLKEIGVSNTSYSDFTLAAIGWDNKIKSMFVTTERNLLDVYPSSNEEKWAHLPNTEISKIYYSTDESLEVLVNKLTDIDFVSKHRGHILWYVPKSIDLTNKLHFQESKWGFSYFQIM